MIEFRNPNVSPEEPNETLYGHVRIDSTGTYIEEERTGVCFSLPEGIEFPGDTYVQFVIPGSGGFIEDMHDLVISAERAKVN